MPHPGSESRVRVYPPLHVSYLRQIFKENINNVCIVHRQVSWFSKQAKPLERLSPFKTFKACLNRLPVYLSKLSYRGQPCLKQQITRVTAVTRLGSGAHTQVRSIIREWKENIWFCLVLLRHDIVYEPIPDEYYRDADHHGHLDVHLKCVYQDQIILRA